MALAEQEQLFFKKQLKLVKEIPPGMPSDEEGLLAVCFNIRMQVYHCFSEMPEDLADQIYQQRDAAVERVEEFKTVDREVRQLLTLSLRFYCFELANSTEADVGEEKRLAQLLSHWCGLARLRANKQAWKTICGSLLLFAGAIELELRRMIGGGKLVNLQELGELEQATRELAGGFAVAHSYCQKVVTIITHLRIYWLNLQAKQAQRLNSLVAMFVEDQTRKPSLLTLDTTISLLYNCLKTLLGVKELTTVQKKSMEEFFEVLGIKGVNRYEQHLLHLFFAIKGMIFRKGEAMERGDHEGDEGEQDEDGPMVSKFANWTILNLQETVLALQEVRRNIIRHRVASLATVIGMKLNLPKFCLNFLQLMHDSSFNNETQSIKLCFELFEAQEYDKLHNCLQVVISAASCKNLREREVLLSMCGIFTGLYLRNREEALLYAKLNHQENKQHVLREETLIQQVGFAYYNLGCHQSYLSNRTTFYQLALNCLKDSIALTPHNYLAQYCLAKIHLSLFDLDSAYRHAMESCRSGRGEWSPFALLACVYYCQRRVSKASAIIDELHKKYPSFKQVAYMKAYLETNKMLLEVEHDEQLQAARELGAEIYGISRDRVMRGKMNAQLLEYCQHYDQLSRGVMPTAYEEQYFHGYVNEQEIMLETNPKMMESRELESPDKGEENRLHIIPLLLEVGMVQLGEKLTENLPQSPQKSYIKALIAEQNNDKPQAILEYKTVLGQLPYHVPSLLGLALLEDNLSEAIHLVTTAEQFESGSQIWFAKGTVLSRLERVSQANEYFLKQGETGWLAQQPDLIYYY